MNDDWRTKSEDRPTKPPRDESRDKRKNLEYSGNSAERFKVDDDDFDCIFTILQEKIFTELKDQNIFQQPKPYNIPEHMKDKAQFCIFHNDYRYTLAACRNLYNQIKTTIRKGELLKYLKKKIYVRSRRESWNSEGLTIKLYVEGTSKNAKAKGST